MNRLRTRALVALFSGATLFLAASCSKPGIQKPDSPAAASAASPEVTKKGDARGSILTRQQAATRAKQIGHVAYTLWFGLDAKREEFDGRVVINFHLKDKARDASDELFVDFTDGTIRSLTLNGATIAEPRYDGHKITFRTSQLNPGLNRIEISFSHKYSTSGDGLHRFKDPVDGRVYLYSDFEPYDAHRMFPCFDQPDLKASYELTVHAPEDWVVVSNTLERDVTKVDGKRSWAFPPSPVFSTYVFALHAGPYAQWKSDADGIPLRLFARKSLAQYVDPPEWFEVTRQGLEFFSTAFGYPYPSSKYDQLIVPDFNAGAMENVAAVTFSERMIYRSKVTTDRRRDRANTILHEMAHMWFGDLVTMRWWNGLWLNESFATFMAYWAVEEATKFKGGSWLSFFFGSKSWAYFEDQLVTTHPIEVSVPDTDSAFANFDGITYGKGASVLKQLAFLLGEDDFKEGLQRYFQKYAYRNTALADFMKSLSEASSRNLATWTHQWLQTSGLNLIETEWKCDAEQKISSFKLNQKNAETGSDLRSHKTVIGFYHWPKKGPRVLKSNPKDEITVEYSQAETDVPSAVGKPCPVLVFPNQHDQDYVKVALDPVSLETVKTSLKSVEDPLTRAALWFALWDQVIDGKLKAQVYAEIALSQVKGETQTQILRRVLGNLINLTAQTNYSVIRFLPEAERAPFQKRAEEFLKAGLLSAPGGSDLQLVWYGAFLSGSSSPEAARFLQALLAGRSKLKGLALGQDLRWDAIQAIARMGAPEAQGLIDAELKKDPTDTGQKYAAAAEAALPDPAKKELWWKRITRASPGEAPMKVSLLKSAMRSFSPVGQEALTQKYVGAFFEDLPRLSRTQEDEYIAAYSASMFPENCTKDVISRASDASSSSLPARALRNLKVGKQETERCLRARDLAATPGN